MDLVKDIFIIFPASFMLAYMIAKIDSKYFDRARLIGPLGWIAMISAIALMRYMD